VIVNERQSGKTYALIQWVKDGEQTDSYPGWSRVILTDTIKEAQRLRNLYDLDYRQVFSVREWQNARLGPKRVDIAVDNVDLVLTAWLRQMPSVITATGRADLL
jgi:hypothetical protein